MQMEQNKYRQQIEEMLHCSDVRLNGNHPWDITVHNNAFYKRVLALGSLGLGESYMDGWWDCEQLDSFFHRILLEDLRKKVKVKACKGLLTLLRAKITNPQKISRAFQVGEHHYDTGNKLFSFMLDRQMNYSCGYWKNSANLDDAQSAKMDLICRKLHLKPGMRVLDIGCGWGGMAKFAAENYGVEVVGVTVSREQAEYAREICKGLPVDIRLEDYRSLHESFDRILSIGMFEHVGYKNYSTFMEICHRNLSEDGLLLLHTIGNNSSVTSGDPWSEKYIFPNSMLPSPIQICKSIEDIFILEDWHNFGADYDHTLMAWFDNFNNHRPELRNDFDDRFYRMWKYYLLSFAGAFRARKLQLWQIVMTPTGLPGGYVSTR